MEALPPPGARPASAGSPRPTIITVICVIGFVGGVAGIPMVFTEASRNVGAWYPPYLGFCVAVGFIWMVGLWKMRRWAVFGYSGFVVLNQIVMLVMGVWNILALVLPCIFIAIMLSQLSKMR